MGELGVAVIVEDDDDVRGLLEGVLRQAGFEVYSASDGREGVETVRKVGPDVVTLDVGLPDIDGFEALRRIRLFSTAYVVMLTGREDEADVLDALQSGADDYITKPFSPREVRARIAAMMRRPRPQQPDTDGPGPAPAAALAQTGNNAPILRHNGLELDCRSRVVSVGGRVLELTRSEFELLHAVLRGGGAVLTRTELVRAARGEQYRDDVYIGEADKRAVELHMSNLRRKLRDDPEAPRWLHTVRGVGYRRAAKSPPEPR